MENKIKSIYNKLELIFIDRTTHQWKNGWQHEGDRLSKELTIQNQIMWNNLFLLYMESNKIQRHLHLNGPSNFSLEISEENHPDFVVRYRFDIKSHNIENEHIYFYITQDKWDRYECGILDMCQKLYDSHMMMSEIFDYDEVPHGTVNPNLFVKANRDRILTKIGI